IAVAPRRAMPAAAPRRTRRVFAWLFLVVTLLSAVGVAVWWTVQSGILIPAERRDTGVPNPPQVLEDEDFDPDGAPPAAGPPAGGPALEGEVMTVFSPDDPTTVGAPGGADAQLLEGEGGAFMRLAADGPDQAVRFDIGIGILERLAGGRAVFSVEAASAGDGEAEIAITCDLGGFAPCRRLRYTVGPQRDTYVFEVALPDARPQAAGTLAIAPDIADRGAAIDVYAIRAAAAR
ncbi:hypothetical protein N1F89_16255, partial [Aquibium sp. A9E412]|nr:hypothetical protein [Aquibium sp. A9E412]